MGFDFAVLGSGRQGTAAAYDLALHGDADRIVIADLDVGAARASAELVGSLLQTSKVSGVALDVADPGALSTFLAGFHSFLSAVPYHLNLGIAQAAIEAGAHMCDLGGNTDIVRQQIALDPEARAAGISIIPDCGQVPGMGTSLMVYAMGLLDEPTGVRMWDGGIPQRPREPWNYILTFNIAGLTNEYAGTTMFLRDGCLVEVECFDPAGYELVDLGAPFGELEAFVTAGGTSTAPWTFAGKLETWENRTLRYPGHASQWKAFSDAGLLELEEVAVGGCTVVPREILHTLLEPLLQPRSEDRDVVLVRVVATGRHRNQAATAQVDLVDFHDEQTGFSAMQRTTGWDGAIVAAMMARGETPRGAIPREISVDAKAYVSELRRRGFSVKVDQDSGSSRPNGSSG